MLKSCLVWKVYFSRHGVKGQWTGWNEPGSQENPFESSGWSRSREGVEDGGQRCARKPILWNSALDAHLY